MSRKSVSGIDLDSTSSVRYSPARPVACWRMGLHKGGGRGGVSDGRVQEAGRRSAAAGRVLPLCMLLSPLCLLACLFTSTAMHEQSRLAQHSSSSYKQQTELAPRQFKV